MILTLNFFGFYMALKKGFCERCEGEISDRIFDVNPEASVCYCTHCLTELKTDVAILNYKNLIIKLLKQAGQLLFESNEYSKAYEAYAYVIDLEKKNPEAHLGRLLSLLNLSSVRKCYFEQAILILKSESSKCIKAEKNLPLYAIFLQYADYVLDDYEKYTQKKLQFHGYYHDVDCLSLHLSHLYKIKNFKQYIFEEVNVLLNKNHFNKLNPLLGKLNNDLAFKEKQMSISYKICDGWVYSPVGFSNDGVPSLTKLNDYPDDVCKKHKPYVLNQGIKHSKYIKDEVFRSSVAAHRFMKISIPLTISCLVLSLACFLMPMLPFITNLIAPFLIMGITFFACAIFTLIFRASRSKKLSKRYLGGMNPFNFK